ncbi:MAG: sulfite exporter TauE/SafE family protein [Nitrososphaerota archaeon]
MIDSLLIFAGIFVLSLVSGMLGLGVAFAAIPFLGLFMTDLVHQVQPLSLLLNGVTALLGTIGFARSGLVDWRKATMLAVVTTVSAPVGALLVQFVEQRYVWLLYFTAVIYLTYRLFRPAKESLENENFGLAVVLAVPISVLSGFLGVGPGFLLMPTLVILGHDPKKAAGINAFAVTPPSFSSLIPHLGAAKWDTGLMAPLVILGAIGSFAGAKLTSSRVSSSRLRQIFGLLIVIVTTYKIYTLIV